MRFAKHMVICILFYICTHVGLLLHVKLRGNRGYWAAVGSAAETPASPRLLPHGRTEKFSLRSGVWGMGKMAADASLPALLSRMDYLVVNVEHHGLTLNSCCNIRAAMISR